MSPGRIRPGAASSSSDASNNNHAAPDDELLEDQVAEDDLPEGELADDDFDDFDEVDELDDEADSVVEEQPAVFSTASTDDLDETSEAVIDEVLAERALEVAPPRDHGVFRRLYYGETTFDFVRRRRIWFTISTVVILAGVLSLAIRGLDMSIEFVGGTSWTVPSLTLTITQTETALTAAGLTGETIVSLGSGNSRSIEVQAKLPKGQSASAHQDQAVKIATLLQKLAHKSSINDVSVESVGPSWGGQITQKAVIALIIFFILVSLYISIFFEWRMALAAIIAVLHDILVTVGIYSLSGFLVTPDTVVAFLTILGYSLYDTIVVFDRVRDNVKNLSVRDRLTFSDIVNLSMNQTLARSLNTSLVAIMPILSVLVIGAQLLGAQTLQYFGLALLVGLTTGAYSSIFIASPLVAVMKEREPKYRQLRARIELRGPSAWLLSPAEVARGFAPETPNRTRSTIVAPQAGGRVRPGSAAKAAATRTAQPTATSSSSAMSATKSTPVVKRPPARRRRGGRR